MAGQNQTSNVDLFDAYFRRADLDQDGKISGAEAVSFFQGANLPKTVLAQIWMHADQNRTGFLGRAEFSNALKLVTVAQSKRELTPDIVKAALYGPAAAKIPAPQINLAATSAPQLSGAAPAAQTTAAPPPASQNVGFRGAQPLSNTGMNQQHFMSHNNQFMRPSQPVPVPVNAGSLPGQGVSGQGFPVRGTIVGPRLPNSNVSTDWLVGRTSGVSTGPTSQVPNSGVTPPLSPDGFGLGSAGISSSLSPGPQASSGVTTPVAPRPQNQGMPSFQQASKDSKLSGNGFASDSIFGGDVFSAISSHSKQDASSSAIVPVTTGTQVKQSPLDSLQSTFSVQPAGGQLQRTQSLAKQNQHIPTQTPSTPSTLMPSGISGGAGNSSQVSWPKMTPFDVQKYTKVFVEVDTDRDGLITGEQARNLFLSWRLPREVLKQVWDLSDQDNDSMLSLREFCTALYLMERYREGRPLPPVLPTGIMFDGLQQPTGQPTAAYGAAAWGTTPGLQQYQGMPGSRPITTTAGVRPQMEAPVQHPGNEPNQQKSRVPVLEKHHVNQLSKEEQNSLNKKFEEATEADKKVQELEKEILDSREKIEYFRTKMQELVLYKSRCDNRLNEITERASADKLEVETLSKKYEEKYKQVGDIASKLTIEEATFRDIQERKMELYNAIVKIEHGGSADGILQVRADRIQSDLEELVKALNERCKKYGLCVKPTALVELPFGWQQSIQEGAADWDEDWDKFEDEGFTFVKELTLDVQNTIAPPKEKSKPGLQEKGSTEEGTAASPSNDADNRSEKHSSAGEHVHQDGSTYAQSEDDSARSPLGSPAGRSTLESPSQEFRESHFGKGFDASPRAPDRHSDHGGAESFISGDKSFDEPAWGTFDSNDDTDSVWGLNSINTKESQDMSKENSFFGSSNLGVNPIRTDSPEASSPFEKKRAFSFGDSVPGTPLFNSGNSPPRHNEGELEDHSFDNFSRFDSFSMNDSGFFPPPENLARFDSICSTRDDHSRGFSSFDEGDPFGSSGPFKTSSENQTPRRDSDHWSAF